MNGTGMNGTGMKGLRAWLSRLVGILPNARRERDLADEIEGHLQMHIDDNVRAGMTRDLARREAILTLGGIESTKEAYRDRSRLPLFDNLIRDFRFAIRQLRKNPGFACTSILMLALGMCASVAIFAFVDAALIAPLPYRNPDRLFEVMEVVDSCPRCTLSYANYLDISRLQKVFRSIAVYRHANLTLNSRAGSEPVNAARVSDSLFRTLGVAPVLGRDFYDGESLQGAPRAVLLSYSSWRRRYNGKPEALGQSIRVEDVPYTIVGVLPAGFQLAPAEPVEFWIAIQPGDGPCGERRSCHALMSVARLKDGVSAQTASANLRSIAHDLQRQYPASNKGHDMAMMTLTEMVLGDRIRPTLLVLLGGAGLLLLIAGVNVASLVLVRSESRKREIAIRSALGASQSRIVTQFVTEGLVLSATGSLIGFVFSGWAMRLLADLIPEDMMTSMPYLRGLGLNSHVAVFAGAIALAAAVLFSITPVLRLPQMRAGLAEGSRGSAGNTWRRLGSRLVVIELATAVVLLVGAGLLGKSLFRLLQVDLGFRPEKIITLQFSAPRKSYANPDKAEALEREIVSRIQSLPGVKSVAVAGQIPVSGYGSNTTIHIAGRPWNGTDENSTPQRDVDPAYFTTLGARLLRGRYFTGTEALQKPDSAIVNQAFAKQYFPGENAVGRQFAYNVTGTVAEIVGVVDNIKEGPLDSPDIPVIYIPHRMNPGSYFTLLVRTTLDGPSLLPAMAAAIHLIDPDVPTKAGATMSALIEASPSAWLHRSSAWLVASFAFLALLLSVVGLYGVVSYSVSQRTREIGVRTALGADSNSVCLLVLKEGAGLTAAGIVAGLICSLAAARLMRGLLFAVESWDLPTLAGVAGVLSLAAMLASYLPARRAASVNPVEALRAE